MTTKTISKKTSTGHIVTLGRLVLVFSLAHKRTPRWWLNGRNTRNRVDSIFSFERIFFREEQAYAYDLTVGRLKLGWMWLSNVR